MVTTRIRTGRVALGVAALLAGLLAALAPGTAAAAPPATAGAPHGEVRVATFNASLYRSAAGALVDELGDPDAEHPQRVAEIVQRQRPDILLLNEFDFDPGGVAADRFHDHFLAVAQHAETEAITYPYRMQFASNTGVPTGLDLDRSGHVGESGDAYGQDAFGYGWFPGQYAFVVYSRFPILEDEVRTFQEFLWRDMPGALLPDDPATPEPADWYSDEILDVFRLSSKNHVDVPIRIGRHVLHVLASHPTPPAFDGPEQRNVLRNHDEVRFWADYVSPGRRSAYIYDDDGERGGLDPGARFVIAGDLNVDPCDGDSAPGAIAQLLDHPLVRDPLPTSEGAVEQAALQGDDHCNPDRHDTADFGPSPGNLRVDYVLPRAGLRVTDSGVFWPTSDWEHFDRLVGTFPFPVSDHRMVHVDLALPLGGRR